MKKYLDFLDSLAVDPKSNQRILKAKAEIEKRLKAKIYLELSQQGRYIPPEYQVVCQKCRQFSDETIPTVKGYLCPSCAAAINKSGTIKLQVVSVSKKQTKNLQVVSGDSLSDAVGNFGTLAIKLGYTRYLKPEKGSNKHAYENNSGDVLYITPMKRGNNGHKQIPNKNHR